LLKISCVVVGFDTRQAQRFSSTSRTSADGIWGLWLAEEEEWGRAVKGEDLSEALD